MRLVFKKAFGIETVPSDIVMWLLELEGSTYTFFVDNISVSISQNTFGNSDAERIALNQFVPSSRRPVGHPIQTLDVALEIDGAVPEAIKPRQREVGAANAFVEPYIGTGFHAVRAFAETYRDCKYLKYRGQERWAKQQTLVPRVTEHEFRTFLFYVIDGDATGPYVGSFSDGTMKISNTFGSDFTDSLQSALEHHVPAERKFIQEAWERLFDEDFSGAVIYSAIAVERAMTRLLQKELTNRSVGTASQIGKVTEDTSNRLLCTILLGLIGIADDGLRQRMVKLFELRNSLAHGKKSNVRRAEAEESIQTSESFLTIAWA